jgi:hypothetical protein
MTATPDKRAVGNRHLRRARLTGLAASLSRAPDSADLSGRALVLVALAALAAGIALGLTASAWAALPARSLQPQSISFRSP